LLSESPLMWITRLVSILLTPKPSKHLNHRSPYSTNSSVRRYSASIPSNLRRVNSSAERPW